MHLPQGAVELFSYSLVNVEMRDEFVDPRQPEAEPATVLTSAKEEISRNEVLP